MLRLGTLDYGRSTQKLQPLSNTISFASMLKSCRFLVTPFLPSDSEACSLREKDPGFRDQVPEETSRHLLGAQDQRTSVQQDQLPCGSTGTSSGNRQETETCMVPAYHTPRQPFQKTSFRAPWKVDDAMVGRGTLVGQPQRVDIPAHARIDLSPPSD